MPLPVLQACLTWTEFHKRLGLGCFSVYNVLEGLGFRFWDLGSKDYVRGLRDSEKDYYKDCCKSSQMGTIRVP